MAEALASELEVPASAVPALVVPEPVVPAWVVPERGVPAWVVPELAVSESAEGSAWELGAGSARELEQGLVARGFAART